MKPWGQWVIRVTESNLVAAVIQNLWPIGERARMADPTWIVAVKEAVRADVRGLKEQEVYQHNLKGIGRGMVVEEIMRVITR